MALCPFSSWPCLDTPASLSTEAEPAMNSAVGGEKNVCSAARLGGIKQKKSSCGSFNE